MLHLSGVMGALILFHALSVGRKNNAVPEGDHS